MTTIQNRRYIDSFLDVYVDSEEVLGLSASQKKDLIEAKIFKFKRALSSEREKEALRTIIKSIVRRCSTYNTKMSKQENLHAE